MFDIITYFNSIKKYNQTVDQIIQNKNIYLLNASTNIQKLLVLELFKRTNKTIILTYSNIYQATSAYNDFLDLTEADYVSFFPVEDIIASELISTSHNYRLERTKTIFKLINDFPQIVITTTEGLIRNIMDKEKLSNSIINLSVGDVYKRDKLIESLIIRGYQKTSFVEEAGTFSVRGSVIDIYAINKSMPIRIEFFDDEIDSIKIFEVSTQKSIEKLNYVDIYPFYDCYYEKEEIKDIKERILKDYRLDERIEQVFRQIENYEDLDLLYLFLPYISTNYQNFTNLVKDKILVFSSLNQILEKEQQIKSEIEAYATKTQIILKNDFFINIKLIINNSIKNVIFENFSTFNNILSDISYSTIDLKTSNNIDYNNYLGHMIDEFNVSHKTYIVTHYDDAKLKLICDLLESSGIEYNNINKTSRVEFNKVNVLTSINALGFIDYELYLEVITPKQFVSKKVFRYHKRDKNEIVNVYSKDELSIGDYVVHADYGIGRYLGIKTVALRGVKNDYLTVEYAGNSKLYIPVDKIYRIQKYLSSFDKVPKLTNINSNEWDKKKNKVKEKVANIAKDLLKIQAIREASKGFVYTKDSEMQLMVENDFDFIETIDQIKAIEEVKKDMESTHPLDRLICGDVGFGKTEIALRAAFKAVDNGKQVVYLAPTTVLSRQHYYTFKDRLEKYGVRVELLNRFVSIKDTKKILEGVRNGYVDILIGTHRILSDDVKYKNLGMLIIDEEQRFGVVHKEKIKQLKANIDILYLTATPIPRTLQMSLSGLRDMSLIETPPINRKSVQTYVLKYNEAVIREAIYREISRGGQVFYLINRIEQLSLIKAKIERLIPQARSAIIHGKMSKEDIEVVLNDFIDQKYDCLVCTTIVETGIDIPNANTLIIEHADHLGLAQLYQIRGRVGRSEQVAYAYLMYTSDSLLTDVAKKRLNTIKEFTKLGSGYKIAMRDLSIRGAGDILGVEQSGFIDDVGIDLYMQLLNEAIEKEKGIERAQEEEKTFDLSIAKTVDNSYVDDDTVKIAIHEEISKIYTKEQAIEVYNEFTDRFGRLSNELKAYIYSKYLETLLKKNGCESYKVEKDFVTLEFSTDESKTIKQKIKTMPSTNWQIKDINNSNYNTLRHIYSPNKYEITITIDKTQEDINYYIYEIIEFLEKLV